jgi:hypothetical protein
VQHAESFQALELISWGNLFFMIMFLCTPLVPLGHDDFSDASIAATRAIHTIGLVFGYLCSFLWICIFVKVARPNGQSAHVALISVAVVVGTLIVVDWLLGTLSAAFRLTFVVLEMCGLVLQFVSGILLIRA